MCHSSVQRLVVGNAEQVKRFPTLFSHTGHRIAQAWAQHCKFAGTERHQREDIWMTTLALATFVSSCRISKGGDECGAQRNGGGSEVEDPKRGAVLEW